MEDLLLKVIGTGVVIYTLCVIYAIGKSFVDAMAEDDERKRNARRCPCCEQITYSRFPHCEEEEDDDEDD